MKDGEASIPGRDTIDLSPRPTSSNLRPPLVKGGSYIAQSERGISVYSRIRGMDFILGGAKFLIGGFIGLTQHAIQLGAPGQWAYNLSPTGWLTLLFVLGTVRWVSLAINGRYRSGWSAIVRAVAAGAAAALWAQLIVWLVWGGDEWGTIFLSILLAMEAYCSWRAVQEAFLIWGARRQWAAGQDEPL